MIQFISHIHILIVIQNLFLIYLEYQNRKNIKSKLFKVDFLTSNRILKKTSLGRTIGNVKTY